MKKQNGVEFLYFVVYWNFLFFFRRVTFFSSTFYALFYSCSALSGILKTALNPSLTLKITYIIKLKYKFLISLGDFCSLFFFAFSSNTLFFSLYSTIFTFSILHEKCKLCELPVDSIRLLRVLTALTDLILAPDYHLYSFFSIEIKISVYFFT